MRIRSGRPLSRSTVALLTGATLLLGACTSDGAQGAASGDVAATPAPLPPPPPPASPPVPPVPEPPPEPTIERLVRTVPGQGWDDDAPATNASFQRLDSSRHRVVGQTLRITEPLELHEIRLWFELATVALPGFRDYPDGTSWDILQQFVRVLPPQPELPISLSLVLYRSPDPDAFPTVRRRTSGFGGVPLRERDVIRIADLEVVADLPLTGRVTTLDLPSVLALPEPTSIEPGSWLFALRVDAGPDDVDLLDLRILGVESGDEEEVRVPEGGRCEYTPTPDAYPDGAFYWGDGEGGGQFIPGYAKVMSCAAIGLYDDFQVMNAGDIAIELWGFPLEQP